MKHNEREELYQASPHLNLLDHDSRWQISQSITVSITVRHIQNIGLAEGTIEIT